MNSSVLHKNMHRLFPDFYCLEGKVGEIGQTKLMCSLILLTAVTLKWEFYNQAAIQKKDTLVWGLTLHTLSLVCIFSILLSSQFPYTGKKNLFNNQGLLKLAIIFFVVKTFMFDSEMILLGEIKC